MGLSRQEVNLRRLLAKCELMSKNPDQKQDERFPKYIDTLEDMLYEVRQKSDGTNHDNIILYQHRISAIKAVLGMPVTTKYSMDDMLLATTATERQMRDELLGTTVRHRSNVSTNPRPSSATDLDQVINYHEGMQQKITADMLTLTQSLKEQSEMANRIIKKDTETITKSTHMTDRNYTKLSTESGKLTEHTKSACKCWMWTMLVVVMIVFINMVLFMKIAKKT